MKRIVLVLIALAALATPASVLAYPLGNFTVNRCTGIELSGEDGLSALRARLRRDPRLPGGRGRSSTRLRHDGRTWSRTSYRWRPRQPSRPLIRG